MNRNFSDETRLHPGGQANPGTPSIPEADVPSRRVVLRGVLAAGCSLLLPTALLGCDSKKAADTAGPAPGPEPAAPPTPSLEPAAPAAPAKVTQASVQYQVQPKDGQTCADCLHFIAESNTCKLVEGDISPDGWCLLWVMKT
jgi:hypothetical protein